MLQSLGIYKHTTKDFSKCRKNYNCSTNKTSWAFGCLKNKFLTIYFAIVLKHSGPSSIYCWHFDGQLIPNLGIPCDFRMEWPFHIFSPLRDYNPVEWLDLSHPWLLTNLSYEWTARNDLLLMYPMKCLSRPILPVGEPVIDGLMLNRWW